MQWLGGVAVAERLGQRWVVLDFCEQVAAFLAGLVVFLHRQQLAKLACLVETFIFIALGNDDHAVVTQSRAKVAQIRFDHDIS